MLTDLHYGLARTVVMHFDYPINVIRYLTHIFTAES